MTPQTDRSPLQSDEDAAARFNEHRTLDPFPDIPSALLNSADIYDYARATGMLYPFDSGNLKSASYEASLGKDCIYWDDDGVRRTIDLSQEGSFILKPNSIAFVTIKERLRLPDYMAVRFNLRITNVHRGLLLGTGPLVDPGFEGHILIPLHNLTTNKYKFRYEEKLIWLEFTKVSPNSIWSTDDDTRESRRGEYVAFPESKKNKPADEYLVTPEIRSSIPGAMAEARMRAEAAEESAKSSERWVKGWTAASAILILIGVGGIYLDIRSITGDLKEVQGTTTERVAGLTDKLNRLDEDIAHKTGLEKQVDGLRRRVTVLEEKQVRAVPLGSEDVKQLETKSEGTSE